MRYNDFNLIMDFVEAGFPAMWVVTHEPEQAQYVLAQSCQQEGYSCANWDCARGLVELNSEASEFDPKTRSPEYPLTPQAISNSTSDRRLILLHNFHRFLDNPLVSQAFYNAVVRGESLGIHYVVLAAHDKAPIELEKVFTFFDLAMPCDKEITSVANTLSEGCDLSGVSDAARGLTRRELRNALALSLYRHGTYNLKLLLDLKAQEVAKSGVLTLLQPSDNFNDLVGLQGVKDAVVRLCQPNNFGLNAKGLLFMGVPGGGKSATIKATASMVNRPLLRLDVGTLLNKYVGESDARLREALRIIEATAPNVVQVEEIEKALAGSSGDGNNDTVRRMMGVLLTWMEERTGPSLVLASANNVSSLPPEFLREGRWTDRFFFDLPGKEEREAVWQLYLKKYKLLDIREGVDDDSWTAGEVKACCEKAVLYGIPLNEASKRVSPVARNRALIDGMRQYAVDHGVLSATTALPYRNQPSVSVITQPVGRKVGNSKTERQ